MECKFVQIGRNFSPMQFIKEAEVRLSSCPSRCPNPFQCPSAAGGKLEKFVQLAFRVTQWSPGLPLLLLSPNLKLLSASHPELLYICVCVQVPAALRPAIKCQTLEANFPAQSCVVLGTGNKNENFLLTRDTLSLRPLAP